MLESDEEEEAVVEQEKGENGSYETDDSDPFSSGSVISCINMIHFHLYLAPRQLLSLLGNITFMDLDNK